MFKTILVNCPPWGTNMPPLGVAYLLSHLKSKGKQVDVCDLNVELYNQANDEQKELWALDAINKTLPVEIAARLFSDSEANIERYIENFSEYDVVGFSANNMISVVFAGMLAEKIKCISKDVIIIVGGPGVHHSWDRRAANKSGIDYFAIGEGEELLNNFIDILEQNHGKQEFACEIAGLLSQSDNFKVKKHFQPAVCVSDIDSITYPTFEEFDLSLYNMGLSYRPLPVLMSRGCINRCSFCVDWYMCSQFRMRDPQGVVDELKHHKRKYGITHVEFNDLLCNGNLLKLEKLCNLLIEEKLDITWVSYAAVRRNMSQALLEKMKQAGCGTLCYGVESGSDNVLKSMNKHYSRIDAAALIKKTQEAGIRVSINIIVGFPGETKKDFEQTLSFITENKKYVSQVTNVSSFVLMPGSDVGIYPHKYGVEYEDLKNLSRWRDVSGISQGERNARVSHVRRMLDEFKINNIIVNYQKDSWGNEPRKTEGERWVSKAIEITDKQQVLKDQNHCGYFIRKHKLTKIMVLFCMTIFSLIMDAYLYLKKKIRGSILFPGS